MKISRNSPLQFAYVAARRTPARKSCFIGRPVTLPKNPILIRLCFLCVLLFKFFGCLCCWRGQMHVPLVLLNLYSVSKMLKLIAQGSLAKES